MTNKKKAAQVAGTGTVSKNQRITIHSATLSQQSPNTSRLFAECSPPEGKGKDVDMVDYAYAPSAAGKAADHCPHQEIIDLYHRILPMGRQVRLRTDARKAKLRASWREDANRQSLEWWDRLFTYIAESAFLTGQNHAPGRNHPNILPKQYAQACSLAAEMAGV